MTSINGKLWTLTIGSCGWVQPELVAQGALLARPDGSEQPIELYVEDLDSSRMVPTRMAFGPEETESILRHFFATGSIPEEYELVPIES